MMYILCCTLCIGVCVLLCIVCRCMCFFVHYVYVCVLGVGSQDHWRLWVRTLQQLWSPGGCGLIPVTTWDSMEVVDEILVPRALDRFGREKSKLLTLRVEVV